MKAPYSKPFAAGSRTARRRLAALVAIVCILVSIEAPAYAAPAGGVIVAGDGAIATDGAQTRIEQQSDRLAINWDAFDVASDESVRFVQPGAGAIALNRVNAADPSFIEGRIEANGQVFLINPHGMVFGNGARVDAAGFVASTLDLDNDAFFNAALDGMYRFAGSGTAGNIDNRGVLAVAGGGYVALMGSSVKNSGEIHAPGGDVALAAGDAVTLYLDGSGLFKAEVDGAAVRAVIDNEGLVAAHGGHVVLTAQSKEALLDTVINHTGHIDASSMEARGGVIVLSGADVLIGADAVLDAGGGTAGGFVETSGERVIVEDGARVTTRALAGPYGTWLIDPVDYVIGPDDPADGSSYVSHATLSANLDDGNITIDTGLGSGGLGNIIVNGPVSWSNGTTLTLKAHNDITLDANIIATSPESGVALLAGKYVFSLPTTVQSADITLAPESEIRAGTLLIGGNPDAFAGDLNPGSIGDVHLDGKLTVDTLILDRTQAAIGVVRAEHADNAVTKIESTGEHGLAELKVYGGSGGLDLFFDLQDQMSLGGNILLRTQGDLKLLAGTKISYDTNPIDIILVSDDGKFVNHAGPDAISLVAEEGQRYLIYAKDAESTLTGGLVGLFVYGKTFATYDEDYGTGFDAENDSVSRFIFAPSDQPTLVFVAKNHEREYGDENPEFDENSWEVQGLAEGETLADVLLGGLSPTLSTAATKSSPANMADGYVINISGPGLSSSKYALNFQPGVLRIKPAPVKLEIGSATRMYGETEWDGPPEVTVTEGLKLGHGIDALDLKFHYNQAPSWAVNTPATPISVTIGNPNYTWANPHNTGELSIRKAPLKGKINTVTREYGASIPDAYWIIRDHITWTGLKNNDNWSVVTANFLDLPPKTGVGAYELASDGSETAVNYDVVIEPGTLVIEPAPLDIRILDAQMEYGVEMPFAAEGLNLRNDDEIDDVFIGIFAPFDESTLDVGNYDITLDTYAISVNYTLRHVEGGTLTITPAPLDIRIHDAARMYGDTDPAFSAEGLTLRNGDALADVFAGVYQSQATAASDVGDYGIELTGYTLSSANYTLNNVENGTLTITPAPLDIRILDDERTYGNGSAIAVAGLNLRNADKIEDVFSGVYTPDEPAMLNVGSYTIGLDSYTLSPNYTLRNVEEGTLTITQAALVGEIVRVRREYGEVLSPADIQHAALHDISWTGFKNGDDGSVVSLVLNDLSPMTDVGTYPLSGAGTADNYIVTIKPGELRIEGAPLTLDFGVIERVYGEQLSKAQIEEIVAGAVWSGFKYKEDEYLKETTIVFYDPDRFYDAGEHALTIAPRYDGWRNTYDGLVVGLMSPFQVFPVGNYSVHVEGKMHIKPAPTNVYVKNVTWYSNEPLPKSWLAMTADRPSGVAVEDVVHYNVYTHLDARTPNGKYAISTIDAPNSHVADVVIEIVSSSPNYVLHDVTRHHGTLTKMTPPLKFTTPPPCFDCGQGFPEALWQALDQGRGNEEIEITTAALRWGDGAFSQSGFHRILTGQMPTGNTTQKLENAMAWGLDDATTTGDWAFEWMNDFGASPGYLQTLVSGERSISAWIQDVEQGSKDAKAALTIVLARYAFDLIVNNELDDLSWVQRDFLEAIGQQVMDQRNRRVDAGGLSVFNLHLDINYEPPKWNIRTAYELKLSNGKMYGESIYEMAVAIDSLLAGY